MRRFLAIAVFLTCFVSGCRAQTNAGREAAEPLSFAVQRIAEFNLPWRIAFLPDGRMLITEKVGGLWLVTQDGKKTPVQNIPAVVYGGQGGMLGVFLSPHYAADHSIYLTYSEPEERGSGLALSRARLATDNDSAKLEDLKVLWHDKAGGRGGQFGGVIAFSPDNKYIFLAVGDRQRMTPAQDINSPLGKTLRLTMDGQPASGNPFAGKVGKTEVDIINPPRDTEAAKSAPTVYTYTYSTANLAPSEIWTMGHRNAYGLAFSPDGRLWQLEHGPRGGDELNLLEPGKNYGWPLVSYSTNYNGVPIPSPETRPDLAEPEIYWTPVIAPGGMVFYNGAMFPQ